MDLANSTVKTPEAESETPTHIQPTKASVFTNGVLKRHAPLHLHHHHPVVVTYNECLKNHAATLGGHAVDGCGEFMPSPASNPAEPTSLKCAACGCHRNFHRREPEEPLQLPPANSTPALEYQPHHRHHPPPPPARGNSGSSPNNSPSPPPISSSYYPSAPHMLLALSHGLSAATPDNTTPISAAISPSSMQMLNSSSRKRYRTKFSQFQKEKMLEFAEKVGWKMQKRDEDAINEFCGDVGVDKGVFKVWMHNNKNTFGKKDPPLLALPHLSIKTSEISASPPSAPTSNGNGVNYCEVSAAAYRLEPDGNSDIKNDDVHGEELGQLTLHDNGSPRVHAHTQDHGLGTNGSSSS